MSDILIFGKGWIGSRLSDFLKCDSTDVRISTFGDVQNEIDKFKPKVIINAIGHYGKNVDDCELDKDKTLFAHSYVPLLLAEAAIRNGIKLVHISSGCIFNYDYKADNPRTEEEYPDFFDLYYSRTKIYAEWALLGLREAANILIVRPRMPLDFIPHPRNLLSKLLSYPTVIDIPNSASYVPDLLEMIKHLIKIDAEGVYNTVNYGGIRFREILEEYRKYNPQHSYAIVGMEELKIVRTNLILSTDKLEETGFEVRDIHDVIPECVQKYVDIVKQNGQILL